MAYRILAQKYRPQVFADVIGQITVTKTLRNSVLNERSANAYIFCGPRGVGKTSVARLLSKMLNCEKPPKQSPCNKCDSCVEITQGNNMDVLEIDGASNNRIDEIRVLLENVQFSPSKGKFKVYIIDEVHMLSTGAFNALLKTLEEPPSHVKFIFATTEPHKVLPTIMSRCQRFDFKRIPPKMIHDRIVDIAEKEKIDIDEKAVLLIARASEGSLRDALVILDQMISFSEEKILPDDVIELMGMVQRDKMFDLTDAVIGGDPAGMAGILDEMITNGKDPIFIANSLIGHYRDLMILKTTGSPTSDMAFTKDELKKLEAQFEKLSIEEILYILQNLTHCLSLMKGAMFVRAPLEVALIRLTKRGEILSLPEILKKLKNIEKCRGDGDIPSVSSVLKQAQGPVRERVSLPETPIVQDEDIKDDEPQDEDADAGKYHWKAILNYVRGKKMAVYLFLAKAKLVQFNRKKVVIGFGKDRVFDKEVLESNGNRDLLEEAVNKITGDSPRIEFKLLDFFGETSSKKKETVKQKDVAKEKMNPVIEKAMDVFGGQVVRDFMEDEQ